MKILLFFSLLSSSLYSAQVVDDIFQFELTNPTTQIYEVWSKKYPAALTLWPGSPITTIEGKLEDIQVNETNRHFRRYMTDLSITGSVLQIENNKFFSTIKPELDSLYKWQKNRKLNVTLLGELSHIDQTRASIADKARLYIKSNLDSELSPFILFFFGFHDPYIPMLESNYLKTIFSNRVKNSVYSQWISNYKE